MGVKHFFIWYKNNFPDCIQVLNNNNKPYIDNLCLDMNGIFHSAAQKIFRYGNYAQNKSLLRPRRHNKTTLKQRLKFFQEVCENVENLRKIINPKKRLILCVDGVAGCAKMAQQRQRRYKSNKDRNDDTSFNPIAITPGTQLMDHLTKYIDRYIKIMLTNSPEWKHLDVIFSNEKVEGEGEHKIINFIRENNNQYESYCIHGLDADLIMLSLGTNLENIHILRENIYNDKELYILNIGLFSERLVEHMSWIEKDKDNNRRSVKKKTKMPAYRKKQAIDDFIFMCFLVGNDFLPTIPTLAILEGSIDVMIDVYKTVGKKHGHLTRVKKSKDDVDMVFRCSALSSFFTILSTYEKEMIESKYEKQESFYPDKIVDTHMKTIIDSSTDKEIFSLDWENYTYDYYISKFGDEDDLDITINNVCNEYLKGMQWVITYYKRGIPDWEWYYPYFYGPFLEDLARNTKVYNSYQFSSFITTPLSMHEQLLSVIPKGCKYLLPSQLQPILTHSELLEYYPDTFEIDYSGKRAEWEGIVILPMMNINKLRKIYREIIEDNDKRSMNTLLYRYNDDFTRQYRSFYGNYTSNVQLIKL
jgi:5'-3' exonuclease